MKFGFLQRIFEKYVNMKYHKNASSCSMRTDRQTDRRADRQTWRS